MFIKFESDAGPHGPSSTRTVECDTYTLTDKPAQLERHIQVNNSETAYVIKDPKIAPGQWNRAYVMNGKGDTIERVYPFPATEVGHAG